MHSKIVLKKILLIVLFSPLVAFAQSEVIMISQYYENGDSDFIEIKNLSSDDIQNKQFYLVLYQKNDKLAKPKKAKVIEINEMAPGEVRVYDKFKLNGDDIIIISTSKEKKCYEDRVDIIGEKSNWGDNISFTKGACASENPHFNFEPSDWTRLSVEEVDAASVLQNIDLGTYQPGSITWNGSKWSDDGLPDRTREVHIEGNYKNDIGDIEACDLIVSAELNFRSAVPDNLPTSSVIIHGDLNITPNGVFKLGDKMSLVMFDDQAEITGEIIKYERTTQLNNYYDFTYWSSPVQDASVEEVFSGVRSGRTYYFDQSRSTASDPNDDPEGTFWNVWIPAGGQIMKPGRGYASEASMDSSNRHRIMFQGKPNNGIIYEQVHYHDDTDDNNDWNIIGNPYPSAIDIDLFFDQNEQLIDPTVYLWTHSTPVSQETGDYSFNDYATYNRTGGTAVGDGPVPEENIGSAQGFMVRAIASGSIEFNNSMRIKNRNDQFFKSRIKKIDRSQEEDRIWLNLTTDHGGFNQLLIGFMEGATNAYDPGYDAVKNQSANKISFYTLLDDKKLAIQGMGLFESNMEIPLGFDTNINNRTYTISVSGVEGKLRNSEIELYDHALGISHNLKNSDYVFEAGEKGSYKERFSLHFVPPMKLSDQEELKIEGFMVYNEGDTFTVTSTSEVETIRIYDILGNTILEDHPGRNSFDVTAPSTKQGEVLLMQIVHPDQKIEMKKIYKR